MPLVPLARALLVPAAYDQEPAQHSARSHRIGGHWLVGRAPGRRVEPEGNGSVPAAVIHRGCAAACTAPLLMLDGAVSANATPATATATRGHTGSDGSGDLAGWNGPATRPRGRPRRTSPDRAILNCTYEETGIGTSGECAVPLFAVTSR